MVVDGVFKNHKQFFINVGNNYRDISIQTRRFLACKILVTWPGAPKLDWRKALISNHIVYKFQLCASSSFWVISELINFQPKHCRFFMFFCVSIFITWSKIPKIGTHDAFINYYVEPKLQLSRFYYLLVTKQVNPHLPKFVNKNKGTTRSREVPIILKSAEESESAIVHFGINCG